MVDCGRAGLGAPRAVFDQGGLRQYVSEAKAHSSLDQLARPLSVLANGQLELPAYDVGTQLFTSLAKRVGV